MNKWKNSIPFYITLEEIASELNQFASSIRVVKEEKFGKPVLSFGPEDILKFREVSQYFQVFLKDGEINKKSPRVIHINNPEIFKGCLSEVRLSIQAQSNLVNEDSSELESLFTNLIKALKKSSKVASIVSVPGTRTYKVRVSNGAERVFKNGGSPTSFHGPKVRQTEFSLHLHLDDSRYRVV
jgi:hypothetical protein